MPSNAVRNKSDEISIPSLDKLIDSKNRFRPEIEDAIVKYWPDVTHKQLLRSINEHFDTNFSWGEFKHYVYNHLRDRLNLDS